MITKKTFSLSLFLAISTAPHGGTSFSTTSILSRTAIASRVALAERKRIFIDGEAGTTGLQVRDRLKSRKDLEILSIADELRKDVNERRRLINLADCVILCLPDEASKEAASMVENDRTVVIDASTAFRVNDDWAYGFPELSRSQIDVIKSSKRISNPGCYPTGFIALIRPLLDAGIVTADSPLTVNAISGYTGGGNALIDIYESSEHEPGGAYAYSMNHKHLPEMVKYTGLNRKPIFQPSVGTFAQGMVVSVPLHYSLLKDGSTGEEVHRVLSHYYDGSTFIKVMPRGESGAKEAGLLERGAFLRPDVLANTNNMELFVFYNDEEERMVLCARLDNLGKGASGAAVQNLNLSLGLDEATGLSDGN